MCWDSDPLCAFCMPAVLYFASFVAAIGCNVRNTPVPNDVMAGLVDSHQSEPTSSAANLPAAKKRRKTAR